MSSAVADIGSLTAIAAIRQYAEIAVNESFILIVLDWFGKKVDGFDPFGFEYYETNRMRIGSDRKMRRTTLQRDNYLSQALCRKP